MDRRTFLEGLALAPLALAPLGAAPALARTAPGKAARVRFTVVSFPAGSRGGRGYDLARLLAAGGKVEENATTELIGDKPVDLRTTEEITYRKSASDDPAVETESGTVTVGTMIRARRVRGNVVEVSATHVRLLSMDGYQGSRGPKVDLPNTETRTRAVTADLSNGRPTGVELPMSDGSRLVLVVAAA